VRFGLPVFLSPHVLAFAASLRAFSAPLISPQDWLLSSNPAFFNYPPCRLPSALKVVKFLYLLLSLLPILVDEAPLRPTSFLPFFIDLGSLDHMSGVAHDSPFSSRRPGGRDVPHYCRCRSRPPVRSSIRNCCNRPRCSPHVGTFRKSDPCLPPVIVGSICLRIDAFFE